MKYLRLLVRIILTWVFPGCIRIPPPKGLQQ